MLSGNSANLNSANPNLNPKMQRQAKRVTRLPFASGIRPVHGRRLARCTTCDVPQREPVARRCTAGKVGTRAILLGAFAVLAGLAVLAGCESLDAVWDEALGPRPPDERTIIAGLLEALETGSANASERAAARDGFAANPLIRVTLPQQLTEVDRTLRRIGLGRQMDDFVLRMNRAAEAASAEAVDVLVFAVRSMTFEDARAILTGPEDAATRYFERTTRAELGRRFQPVVTDAMEQTGLTSIFRFVIDSYNRLPLVEPASFDIDDYVVNATLDGLFVLIAQEEQAIRTDPAARVTELLRRVFAEQ